MTFAAGGGLAASSLELITYGARSFCRCYISLIINGVYGGLK